MDNPEYLKLFLYFISIAISAVLGVATYMLKKMEDKRKQDMLAEESLTKRFKTFEDNFKDLHKDLKDQVAECFRQIKEAKYYCLEKQRDLENKIALSERETSRLEMELQKACSSLEIKIVSETRTRQIVEDRIAPMEQELRGLREKLDDVASNVNQMLGALRGLAKRRTDLDM